MRGTIALLLAAGVVVLGCSNSSDSKKDELPCEPKSLLCVADKVYICQADGSVTKSKDCPDGCLDGKCIEPGDDGDDGSDGTDGTSVVDGTDGGDGTDSEDGTDSTDGTDGTDGGDATDGTDGADGLDATDGTDGLDATDGTDGIDATDGLDATDGVDGTDAVDGTDGVDGTPGEEVTCSLINNPQWQAVEKASDPFWANDAKATICEFSVDANGNGVIDVNEEKALYFEDAFPVAEGIWYSITTTTCNYATLVQPLLNPLPKGATLGVRIYHTNLKSPTGEFTLTIGAGEPSTTIFSTTEAIQAGNGWVLKEIVLEQGFSAGENLYFNLTNHGPNEWNIVEIKATFHGACAEGTEATPGVGVEEPKACGSDMSKSCKGQCNGQGTADCWCDKFCEDQGTCCPDYKECCISG